MYGVAWALIGQRAIEAAGAAQPRHGRGGWGRSSAAPWVGHRWDQGPAAERADRSRSRPRPVAAAW